MDPTQHTWAVVLAAGDGTRLARLTTDERGNPVPKQFCSLNGGSSLLQDALLRARRVVPRERVCAVVASQHERYWGGALWAMPAGNLIVQPRNCGTAVGVLLAVLGVLAQDPLARIIFLPADHFVRDESALAETLCAAVTLLERRTGKLLLVGIEPDEIDPELGYIVPEASDARGPAGVVRFVEKPSPTMARELLECGAVWNSFIFAGHGPATLGLLRSSLPRLVEDMETALARDVHGRQGPGRGAALRALYETLPSVDFSREVLQGAEAQLAVLTAPSCGWSDLGTPHRVAQTLQRLGPLPDSAEAVPGAAAHATSINLAVRQARLSRAC